MNKKIYIKDGNLIISKSLKESIKNTAGYIKTLKKVEDSEFKELCRQSSISFYSEEADWLWDLVFNNYKEKIKFE